MFKEKENKWTRERSFLEVHAGDFMVLATVVFFGLLTIGGVAFLIIQPRIPGLHELFSAPPPNPADQKLHLAPGETEIKLYPGKPVTPPPPPKK